MGGWGGSCWWCKQLVDVCLFPPMSFVNILLYYCIVLYILLSCSSFFPNDFPQCFCKLFANYLGVFYSGAWKKVFDKNILAQQAYFTYIYLNQVINFFLQYFKRFSALALIAISLFQCFQIFNHILTCFSIFPNIP